MRINKLRLINIRSFKNIDIKFSPTVTLLVGANGAGKSTILLSLQMLQNGLPTLGNEDVRKTTDFGKVLVQLSDISSAKPFPGEIPQPPHLTQQRDVLFSFWPQKEKAAEKVIINPVKANIEYTGTDIIAKKDNDYEPDQSCFPPFPGFPSMEDESNFIYPFLSRRKVMFYSHQAGWNAAFEITEGLHHLPSRIQKLTNPSHPNHKRYVQLCEELLGFIVGNVPSKNANENKLGSFVKQNEMIYLESMGEGTANILGLLTILLTEDDKLFLIEELENDIHPAALKKLLSLIIEKSNNNQFIITTHSNIVLKYLASVKDAKIFYTECSMQDDKEKDQVNMPTSTIVEIENKPEERLRILEKLGYDFFRCASQV